MPRPIMLDSKPRRLTSKHGSPILFREEDGKVIMLVRHQIYILNKFAKEILFQLDGQTTLQELIDRLLEKYELPYDRIKGETLKFIEFLDEKELITFDLKAG